MKVIYLDTNFKCHIMNDGTMTAIETNFFDGKCDAFIEGYMYIPENEIWTRSDGIVFYGEMIIPWKPYSELDAAQRQYERNQLVQLQNNQNELNTSYQEGINSI